MLQAILSILHSISGKIFWFSSAYFPLSHPVRVFVENGLLWFYRWEIGLALDLSDTYSKLASLLANKDQLGQGIAYYTKAMETNHTDLAKISYFMGRQKARLHDIKGAIECFQSFVRMATQARDLPPEYSDSWSRLEEDPDFDPRRFHGYLYLGNKCIESGLETLAVEFLQTSITLEPLVSEAYTTLGEVFYTSGRSREALELARTGHFFQLRRSHPHIRISPRSGSRIAQPDFMILGKWKCGTTSLYSYLTRHPCITPALTKELYFFDALYDRGLDWYLAQFPPIGNHPEVITGEASAGYIDSQLAAERIKEHFPHTRFIVLLRNPVDRAISHGQMAVRNGRETGELETALLHGVNPATDDEQLNTYVDCSIYVKMLKVWMAMFPREQFLILSSERLFAAPAKVTNEVFEFLGQTPFTADDYPVINKGSHASVDGALKQTLRDYFLLHNQALEEFLGMRFDWND